MKAPYLAPNKRMLDSGPSRSNRLRLQFPFT